MPISPSNSPNKPSFKSRKAIWTELIGNQADFTLESRIFHSISLGIIVLLTLYIPYNLFADLYAAAISAILVVAFYSYQYYRSRFLRIAHSNMAFGFLGILILGVNYFLNSGINGSTDLIWPIYLLLLLAISPYRQHLQWVIFYLTFFIIIHYMGYRFPFLVQYPFTAGKGQFIDRISVFPMPIIVIYLIITFIRQNYDQEKKIAEEKTLVVEASKEQISLHKDQLEQSNLEKSKLMSIISHDLRSPLLNIQNYLELLKEYELDSTERLGMEKTLLNSTNNAMEMLSNLLNWSKSQMDGVSTHLKEVNLLQILSSTLEMEQLHASKKNIALTYQIPSIITVIADEDMFQLVIRNLISNAIKFTPEGGLIHVKAELIQNQCQIIVEDNGKGIPLDKQGQIFHIKSQPEYGTNHEKGVGLGLALCKEFTERQGGAISFQSTPGEGTRFFVLIPAKGI